MPKRFFVTRHRGAITWATRHGLRAQKISMENFDLALLSPGDVVMGTLPMQLVAELNNRGCHYWHLSMEIPPELRGKELSADDMDACGAKLHEYRVLPLGPRHEEMKTAEVWAASSKEKSVLHLCVATGQQIANAAPLLLKAWAHVVIFASQKMDAQAKRLAAFAREVAQERGADSAQAVSIEALQGDEDLPALRRSIQAAVTRLRARYPGHEFELNMTGGTKLMSLAFTDALRGQATIVYCDAAQGYLQTVEPEGRATLSLDRLLTVPVYMRVQGFQIRGGGEVDDVQREVILGRKEVTATLALEGPALGAGLKAHLELPDGRKIGPTYWMALIHVLAARVVDLFGEGKGLALEQSVSVLHGSLKSPDAKPLLQLLVEQGLLARAPRVADKDKVVTLQFTGLDAARYLAGGYMEEFAWISADSLGLPAQHLSLGLRVDTLKPLERRSGDTLNELDVVVAWKARLLILECKAGRQLSDGEKVQTIINRSAALRESVGGALGQSWIVSTHEASDKHAADAHDRAKVTRVSLQTGAKALARLPKSIADWAEVPLPETAIRWTDEVRLKPAQSSRGLPPSKKPGSVSR